MLFEARGDGPEMLEFVEETLDPIAEFVKQGAEGAVGKSGWPFSPSFQHDRPFQGGVNQPIGIVVSTPE